MNSSHFPQMWAKKGLILQLLGLVLAFSPEGSDAFTPEGHRAPEILRESIAAGAASEESYGILLGMLSEADKDWDTWDARLSIAQTTYPRQSDRGSAPAPPAIGGEGVFPNGAWRFTTRENQLQQRYVRFGTQDLSLHAGHIHSMLNTTRLDFVAGSRFYAGSQGVSGVGEYLHSRQSALDGLGISSSFGAWSVEAAGTWNRLSPTRSDSFSARRDAILFMMGVAREPVGLGAGLDFRIQSARQRLEVTGAKPATITVLGARLANRHTGAHWHLGAAGSVAKKWGGYLEASLESKKLKRSRPGMVEVGLDPDLDLDLNPNPDLDPDSETAYWRLAAHQADENWANPLQSPRGYLRDTLDNTWIISGQAEGGFSGRTQFPIAVWGEYQAAVRATFNTSWAVHEELSATNGGSGLTQVWKAWTYDIGSNLGFRRPELASWNRSWAQSLAWKNKPWLVKAAFMWTGGGYSGTRPAALSLALDHQGPKRSAWGGSVLVGDVRKPARYLRMDVKQTWMITERIRLHQALRIPWSHESLGDELRYQLRLNVRF